MKRQRLLVLGGSRFQVPLIERAVREGLYVITCDYLPTNPGHTLAHEYHEVSTTDVAGVVRLAEELAVDAVMTFASDPSVLAVAHACERLGLPGPSVTAIETLADKERFRSTQRSLGLTTPAFQIVTETDRCPGAIEGSEYVVKPVDSAGSKGVTIVRDRTLDLTGAVQYALGFSRSRRCIVEQRITGRQVHGDVFVQGGQVAYQYLGDQLFREDAANPAPLSTRWPSSQPRMLIDEILRQANLIVDACGYHTGPINLEARVSPDGEVFIIELGPRNGGNYVPHIQERLTGVDLVGAALAVALGEVDASLVVRSAGIGAQWITHSSRRGRFGRVEVAPELAAHRFFENVNAMPGDEVAAYTGSNTALGVVLFEFPDITTRDTLMARADQLVRVVLEEDERGWCGA